MLQYELIRSGRSSLGIIIKDGKVIVRAPRKMPVREINRFLEKKREWIEKNLAESIERKAGLDQIVPLTEGERADLMRRGKKILEERAAFYAPIVGVSYKKLAVRMQKSKWGSCSGRGTISLNCLLLLTPPEVMDSVVVHELCHLLHMDHSGEFYREVYRVCPDYGKCDLWLKENGAAVLRRGAAPEKLPGEDTIK